MKKKYELIGLWSGIIGVVMLFVAVLSAVYFVKIMNEDSSSWFWKSLAIVGVGMSMMIPMIVYSNKSFNMELQEVRNKTDEEVDEWIDKMVKEDKTSRVDSVMSRIDDYEKRWVRK